MQRRITGVGVRLVEGKPPPNGWDTWSDEELVRQAAVQIEGPYFEVLYTRHTQGVHHTIYQFLRGQFLISDHTLAEDLTQDTFVQAWKHLSEKNPQSPFLPWLKVIARNEVLQYMRRRVKEIGFTGIVGLTDGSSSASSDQIVQQARIEQIKLSLPKRQQLVFRLHHELGYAPREIAQQLKRKPATIWQTLWRAHERFRAAWQQEEDALPPLLTVRKAKRGKSL